MPSSNGASTPADHPPGAPKLLMDAGADLLESGELLGSGGTEWVPLDVNVEEWSKFLLFIFLGHVDQWREIPNFVPIKEKPRQPRQSLQRGEITKHVALH